MASIRKPRRRWLSGLLVALALVIAAALHAALTATTVAPFGPHMATYAVTTSGTLTIDLGPLGTIQRPSPAPGPIGIGVQVHEIPESYTGLERTDVATSLTGDLQRYLTLFASPQDTLQLVATGLIRDAGRTFLLDTVWLAVAVGAVAVLVGRRRGASVRRAAALTAPWVCVGALLIGTGVAAAASRDAVRARSVPGATVFAGTALAGTRITGRLGGVLEQYGGQVIDAFKENDEFYSEANTNLERQWQLAAATPTISPAGNAAGAGDAAASGSQGLSGQSGAGDAAASGSQGSAAPSGAAGGEMASSENDVDLVTMLVISDMHCNISMSPLVGTLARESGASIILNAGDATIDGTAVEQTCPESLMRAVPKEATLVYAGGNHDSDLTADQFEAAGATVLRGQTVSVDGVRILGDLDPWKTNFGSGTSLARSESASDFQSRIIKTACDEAPDLLLIHTPYEGRPALDAGCAPYLISGHMHRRVGPEARGSGVEYVNASSAGATEGEPTLGPLRGDAEMTVLTFDRVQRRIVDYRVVTVHTDASVDIGEVTAFPLPSQFA
ncbi:calcineurin-like phosphoesterase family protein [Rarobacter incanus]|uniref:Calcineurin-like phosphoesterase family protein n=2 Tax=Rarobacter incanus TaxID=153494 RepID=A0A542SMV7_9MICO|nr:calcineurin-like phosphoesterase family protein [Rarobacter incanus]